MKQPLINISTRWRLLISMTLLGVLFSVTLIAFSTHSQKVLTKLALDSTLSMNKKTLLELDQGRFAADQLAHAIAHEVSEKDLSNLSNTIHTVLRPFPDVCMVVVKEKATGNTLMRFDQPRTNSPNEIAGVSSGSSAINNRGETTDNVLQFIRPIIANNVEWGTLTLIMASYDEREQINQINREMTIRSKSLITKSVRISILFLAAGVILILVVSTRLADPIVQLTESAQEIARGNFTAINRLDTSSGSEIGKLSHAFVKMANDLEVSYNELKRTAEDARRTGSFLDSILEHLPHMIFVKDAKTLNFTLFNKAGEDLIGCPREKMIGKNDYDFFTAEQADFFTANDRKVLKSGNLLDITEEKMTRPDGEIRYLHTKKIPLIGPDGQPKFLLGISEDISSRKNAELERQMFFNHSMDLMCIANMEGKFEQVNPAFISTMGYTSQELCSRPYFDFVHPDDVDSTIVAAQKLNEGVPVVSFENRYICKDGSIRWLTWNAGINREFKKVYAIARDTTAQRNMEERIFQAGLKEQERIARDLHDGLGQILTALAYKGKLIEQMLRNYEKPTASQATEIVLLANRASEQARVLARGLDPVVLQEGLVMALRDLAHTTTENFGIACSFTYDNENEFLDKNIANHLFRIAQEAVNNAVKHGHAHDILISLESDESTLSLTIHNDGLSTNGSLSRTSGLGIHTMNYRAKLIGGALTFTPNPGVGLTVRCTVRKKVPTTPDVDPVSS